MNNIEKLNYMLAHAKHDENLAAAVFQLIQFSPKEDCAALLELFFKSFCEQETEKDLNLPVFFTAHDTIKLMRKYGPLADERMVELQKQNLENEEFYRQLWEYISESPVFPGTKARMFLLYNYGSDLRMPYWHLDFSNTLDISREECSRICSKIRTSLRRVRFIVRTGDRKDRTRTAAILLQEMNKLEDDREKCILLSAIMNMCS